LSSATARRPGVLPGADARLRAISRKVANGRRLSVDDGLLLYETPDIWSVCALADLVRRRLHGDVAFYNINRHVNYSNVCALSCTFCSFYRKQGQPGAYEYSIDKIRQAAAEAAEAGATEIHIVGGLHPELPFEYYTAMLNAIRDVAPGLHIKAFTAVEIVHLARISKRGSEKYEGIKSVLQDLMQAGLGSLPGGGAEVFDDRVHDEAFKGKIRAGTWLDVHRAAHELGLPTNATMLYGHVESRADRVRHLDILRRHQDDALRDWALDRDIGLQTGDAVVLFGPGAAYPGCPIPARRGRAASRRSSPCRSFPMTARWLTCPDPAAWKTSGRWPSAGSCWTTSRT
jgi:aminodeoxyfutalosine synthase